MLISRALLWSLVFFKRYLDFQNSLLKLSPAAFFYLLGLSNPANAVFNTPGIHGVSQTGAATYTIPIQVPPGRAGMAPQLALSYNSQQKNGIAGPGWNVSGISSITRCAKTIAQDGVTDRFRGNSDDRFCLDGQKLILVNGTYGSSGSEYRTEINNFSKVVYFGTFFKVWTRGGLVVEYGNTVDSKVVFSGTTTMWAQNRVLDQSGNGMRMIYVDYAGDGSEVLLSTIEYTNTESTPSFAKVQFNYTAGNTSTIRYLSGFPTLQTNVLSKIETYLNGVKLRSYNLAYRHSKPPAYVGPSALISVTECIGSECLRSTSIQYYGVNDGTFTTKTGGYQIAASPPSYGPGYRFEHHDLNGDGKAEAVAMHNSVSGNATVSIRAIPMDYYSGNLYSVWVTQQYPMTAGSTIQMADVDGDGKEDVIATNVGVNGGSIYVWLAFKGSSFGAFSDNPIITSAGGTYGAGYALRMADVNGDGRQDAIISYIGSGGIRLNVMLSNGNGTFAAPISNSPSTSSGYSSGWNLDFVDVDGDRKVDAVASYIGNAASNGIRIYVMLSNGTGGFSPIISNIPIATGYGTGYKLQLADINGDGCIDAIATYIGTSGIRLNTMLSKGNGYFGNILTNIPATSGYSTSYLIKFADIDGDGKDDAIATYIGSAGIKLNVMLSLGMGDFAPIITNTPFTNSYSSTYTLQFTDLNGDGKADAVASYIGSASSNGYAVDAMMSWTRDATSVAMITDGIGNEVSFIYSRMDDSSVLDGDAVYPVQDVKFPLNVVIAAKKLVGSIGWKTTYYKYTGPKLNVNGRGFLGFRVVQAESPISFSSTKDFLVNIYRQDYPYIGMLSESATYYSSFKTDEQKNSFASTLSGSGFATTQFPYISQSTIKSYAPNVGLLSTITANYQYDPYGNVIQSQVNADDGSTKTTTNVYSNDAMQWRIGRLLRSSVTTTIP